MKKFNSSLKTELPQSPRSPNARSIFQSKQLSSASLISTISASSSTSASTTASTAAHSNSSIRYPETPTTPTANVAANLNFSTGDRVRCSNGMVGICKYIGTIDGKPGIWVGIDLGCGVEDHDQDSLRGKGKNSGSVNGISYFECDESCGIFFPIGKVSAYPFTLVQTPTQAKFQAKMGSLTLNTTSSPSSTSLKFPSSSSSSSTISSSPNSASNSAEPDSPAQQQDHLARSTSSGSPAKSTSAAYKRLARVTLASSPTATPKPRARPSLPSQTFLTRNPLINHAPSLSNLKAGNPTRWLPTPARKPTEKSDNHPLLRNSPSKAKDEPSSPSKSSFLRDTPRPLPDLYRSSTQSQSTDRQKNRMSMSLSSNKRASLAPSQSRQSSHDHQASLPKRSESVNSHYRTTEWTSSSRRPLSRLSQISNDSSIANPKPVNPKKRMSIAAPENRPSKEKASREEEEREREKLKEKEAPAVKEKFEELEKTNQSLQQQLVELNTKQRGQRIDLELELDEMKKKLKALEDSKEEEILNSQKMITEKFQLDLSRLEQERQSIRSDHEELVRTSQSRQKELLDRIAESEKERIELIDQLNQLRSAGQSLCSVYEDKIHGLENLRIQQLEESNRLIEELRRSGQPANQNFGNQPNGDSVMRNSGLDRSQHRRAIEIDNESLKADLKYANEKLSEAQEKVYQLQDQLQHETQSKQDLVEKHGVEIQNFKLNTKKLKEENMSVSKEKDEIQAKLNQVEAKFKECLETMEHERIELEGLRDEILVAQPRSTPYPKNQFSLPTNNDDSFDGSDVNENVETAKILYGENCRLQGSRKPSLKVSSFENFDPSRQEELEVELKNNRVRIQELESKLQEQRLGGPSPAPSSSIYNATISNSLQVPESSTIEQEKMKLTKKYQRLLSIKDEENLSLLNRVQELEEQQPTRSLNEILPNNSLSRTPSFHGKHHLTARTRTGTFPGLHKSVSHSSLKSNITNDGSQSANENAKANQEILGLKLIVNQSNEDRVKVETENRKLKDHIEELKRSNQKLEKTIEKLLISKKSSPKLPNVSPSSKSSSSSSSSTSASSSMLRTMNVSTPTSTPTSFSTKSFQDEPQTIATNHQIKGLFGRDDDSHQISIDLNADVTELSRLNSHLIDRLKRLESEIESMKKIIEDLNKKRLKEVNSLNKEVSELESIIESKVFKEEELESEVERLRELIESSTTTITNSPNPSLNNNQNNNTDDHHQRHNNGNQLRVNGVEGSSGRKDWNEQRGSKKIMRGEGEELIDEDVYEDEEGASGVDQFLNEPNFSEGGEDDYGIGEFIRNEGLETYNDDDDNDDRHGPVDGDGQRIRAEEDEKVRCELCESEDHLIEFCPIFIDTK